MTQTPFDRDAAKRAPSRYRFDWSEPPVPENTATYTLDRQLAQWRAETSPERIAQLNREWIGEGA